MVPTRVDSIRRVHDPELQDT